MRIFAITLIAASTAQAEEGTLEAVKGLGQFFPNAIPNSPPCYSDTCGAPATNCPPSTWDKDAEVGTGLYDGMRWGMMTSTFVDGAFPNLNLYCGKVFKVRVGGSTDRYEYIVVRAYDNQVPRAEEGAICSAVDGENCLMISDLTPFSCTGGWCNVNDDTDGAYIEATMIDEEAVPADTEEAILYLAEALDPAGCDDLEASEIVGAIAVEMAGDGEAPDTVVEFECGAFVKITKEGDEETEEYVQIKGIEAAEAHGLGTYVLKIQADFCEHVCGDAAGVCDAEYGILGHTCHLQGEVVPEVPTDDPEGGETDPEGGETDPEGGETDPEGGETDPEGGETDPEGGETDPEGGETDPEGGETDPETDPEGSQTDASTSTEAEDSGAFPIAFCAVTAAAMML